MTRFERLFVWLGGLVFVSSLAVCVYHYVVVWANPSRPAVSPGAAVAVDMVLFAVFAAHHSLLARDAVKEHLARLIPERLLRSVYVWTASLLLIGVCVGWQPIAGDFYRATGWRVAALVIVQLGGLLIIAQSVRAIDALELAGIRRQHDRGGLQITGPYRMVRHPLYLGWMLAAFGAPHMTGDRLAFAVISSAYLLVAIPWEERSLSRSFGAEYRRYQQRVRWRVLPLVY
jgi:methanethiol S-methyltransferase